MDGSARYANDEFFSLIFFASGNVVEDPSILSQSVNLHCEKILGWF